MSSFVNSFIHSLLRSEVGVAKQVERTLVIDNDGRAVMLVKETTGVVVENEEGRAVAVQTAVHGVVLGNVLGQQEQPKPAIQAATPTITQPSGHHDNDGCCSHCSCCCVIKWTLISILCLPCIPLICVYYCCCRDDDD